MKTFLVTEAQQHINPNSGWCWHQPLAYCSLEVAKQAIDKELEGIGERSHWVTEVRNPLYTVHHCYSTITLPNNSKIFNTWVIVETEIQGA